jgi:TonB family protein
MMKSVAAWTTVFLLSLCSHVAGSTPKQKKSDSRACAPIAVKNQFPEHLPGFKGKKYISPIISFDIGEAGDVSNVAVKRSSGDADFDASLKKAVEGWKYKPQPGCGVRSSEISISVHFVAH